MFKKQEENNYERLETILGKNFHVEGNVKASGSVRIDGFLKGEIEIQGDLVIGESAFIEGTVKASNVHMAGKVSGNLHTNGNLKLASTAQMLGDIYVKKFISDEGAIFQGKCIMDSQETLYEKPLASEVVEEDA